MCHKETRAQNATKGDVSSGHGMEPSLVLTPSLVMITVQVVKVTGKSNS